MLGFSQQWYSALPAVLMSWEACGEQDQSSTHCLSEYESAQPISLRKTNGLFFPRAWSNEKVLPVSVQANNECAHACSGHQHRDDPNAQRLKKQLCRPPP
jgi:hypothetical protein